jgi:hypothetical protein
MFFFLNWGSKWKYNVKEGGLRVEKLCPECGGRGKFFEVIPTKYFSIFWIPVAPTESKKPLLECPNCHERFYIQQADYLSAINDLGQSKTKHNKVIHLPQDSIDAYIVQCDNCGQKLKVPKNDRMLKVTCPSCKNTFHFQKGEKVQEAIEITLEKKATFIDPHSKSKASEKTWWRKHSYSLIGAAIIWGIIICFLLWPENKPQVEIPSIVPPSPPQTSSALDPKVTKLKPTPTEKPQKESSTFPVVPVEPINPKRLPNGSSPFGPGIRSGLSTLTVDNGTDTDAFIQVMRLMDKEQYMRRFYIQSKSKWTEKRLPPGQYVIKIAFGKDWNPKYRKQTTTVQQRTHLFNFQRSYSKTEPFEIKETTSIEQTEDGQQSKTKFTEMSITLHKVPLGNFKTYGISEEEFMETLSDF